MCAGAQRNPALWRLVFSCVSYESFRCWCDTATFSTVIGAKRYPASFSERIKNYHITLSWPSSFLDCLTLWTESYPTTSAVQELQVSASQAIEKTGHLHQVDMSMGRRISTQVGDDWGIPGVVCFAFWSILREHLSLVLPLVTHALRFLSDVWFNMMLYDPPVLQLKL
jgi:hypothetical protein